MDAFILLVLTLLFPILACASLYLLVKQPFNVLFGLVFLCIVFFLFPALAWMHGYCSIFEYGFRTCGTEVRIEGNISALATVIGMTVLLLAGAITARAVPGGMQSLSTARIGSASVVGTAERPASTRALLLLFGLIWLAVVLMIQHRSGLSAVQLILPAAKQKDDVYGSFYIFYCAMFIPLAVGTVLYFRSETLRWAPGLCFLLSIMVALGAAQRRNVLIVILYVVALRCSRPRLSAKDGKRKLEDRRVECRSKAPAMNSKILALGLICLALGPMLWWARCWFTAVMDPVHEVTMPWERQGFLELLFGSAAAGFPTFMLVQEWIETDGVQWGTSVLATVCIFVPRQLWADKPPGAELLLQQRFGLDTMPSTFFINELYLNAGQLSLPLAFMIGRALSGIHQRCAAINSPRCRVVNAAMFGNLATIFKNGLGPFVVNVVFMVGLCWCAMIYEQRSSRPRGRQRPANALPARSGWVG